MKRHIGIGSVVLFALLIAAAPASAADHYVCSTDGSDSDNGTTWALAKATVAAMLNVPVTAGDRVFVCDTHAETQATALTWTSPGTSAAPVQILCSDNATGAPPTSLVTTCTVTTTSTSAMSFTGHAYAYGITFNVGTLTGNSSFNFVSTTSWWWKLESSTIALVGTHTASRIVIGATSAGLVDNHLELVNTVISFAAAGQAIAPLGRLTWVGGSLAGTVPTSLFKLSAGATPSVRVIGVDLSALDTSEFLVDLAVNPPNGIIDFINCKLGAGVALTTGAHAGPGGALIRLINSDSGDTNYRMQFSRYEGDVYSETTIVKTGGSSDGTTPISHKMTSSAGANIVHPLPGPEVLLWNDTTGASKTLTLDIVHDSATPLTNAEVWIQCYGMNTSGFPIYTLTSDRAATVIASAANQTASTAVWGAGLSAPNEQKLSVTFTTAEKGLYSCQTMLGKASYTIYSDGKLVVE